eukprot:6194271-Pleurochrysis_carterae.AAC.1
MSALNPDCLLATEVTVPVRVNAHAKVPRRASIIIRSKLRVPHYMHRPPAFNIRGSVRHAC